MTKKSDLLAEYQQLRTEHEALLVREAVFKAELSVILDKIVGFLPIDALRNPDIVAWIAARRAERRSAV